MSRNWNNLLVVALCAALSRGALGQTASGAIDPATLAPRDAVVFMGTPDLNALMKAFMREGGDVLADPATKGSADRDLAIATRVLFRLRQRLADALETEPDKLKNPFAGAAMIYVVPPKGEGEPEIASALGVGDKALMRDYYDKITKRMRELFAETKTETYRDVEILEFVRAAPAEGADEDEFDPNDFDFGTSEEALDLGIERLLSPGSLPDRLACCLAGDRLWVGGSTENLKAAMRVKPGDDALVDAPTYKRFERVFAPLGQFRFYFDVTAARKFVERELDAETREMIELLGLDTIEALVGHGSFQTDGFNVVDMLMMARGEFAGLPKLLALPNAPIAPDRGVSDQSTVYGRMNLDVANFVTEIERLVRRANPESADAMREALERAPGPDGETINLRRELIEPLKGPVALAARFDQPYSVTTIRWVMSVGHRDQSLIVRTLTKVVSSFGMFPREYQGVEVFDVPPFVSIAVTPRAVLIGDRISVEVTIAGGAATTSLADHADYALLAKRLPSDAGAVFFVDQRAFYRGLNGVRESLGIPAEAMDVPTDPAMIDKLKPSLLTVTTTPEGLRITQFTIAQEKR